MKSLKLTGTYFTPLVVGLVAAIASLSCSKGSVTFPEQGEIFTGTEVFVDVAAADGGLGTREKPLRSIQAGIDLAAENGLSTVNVAAGNYTHTETLRLEDGVSLLGGFESTFSAQTGTSAIEGPATAIKGDDASSLAIDGFAIESRAAADLGESSIAIHLHACNDVTITNSDITAGSGAAGDSPDGPPPAPAGANGIDGGQGPSIQSGGAGGGTIVADGLGSNGGGGGDGGAPGEAGRRGIDGQPSGSGGDGGRVAPAGERGNDGVGFENGTAAPGVGMPGGDDIGLANDQGYVPSNGEPGKRGEDGFGGGGGGGGGGSLTGATAGGGGGGGGEGGQGGFGGLGGGGGGASIGVLLTGGSTATIENNVIVTADGGAGGNGAKGGVGGAGGQGGTGAFVAGLKGGDGGRGQDGGRGGPGGGGGGGPSIGILISADSEVTPPLPGLEANDITPGNGGAGGLDGTADPESANNGANGMRASFLRRSP